MQSIKPRKVVSLALLPLLLTASGCGKPGGFPPLADVQAVTEAKPLPSDAIVTDPVAAEHYNADVESWGDRISSAGKRLCVFFKATGMPGVDCQK